jgi:hypothetical protein
MVPEQMGECMASTKCVASNCEVDSTMLRSQLEKLERKGVKLYFNGAPSTTEYIVNHCVNEDTVYMPDYVTDESGKVREVRYDLILEQ